MNVSEELLDKYFKGQCSSEEELQVLKYLNAIDDLPEHLLSKKEWDDIADADLADVKTDEMFDVVKLHTLKKNSPWRLIKFLSAAAMLFAVLAVGLLQLNTSKPVYNLVKSKTPVNKENAISWKSVTNYTLQTQLFTLPDQSTVKLYPDAELRYAVPFVKDNREVYLNGKGFFEVTKDQARPFIVYTKGVSTTALGTSFTITALAKSHTVKVQLHTGKVRVEHIDSLQHTLPFSKILLPGNELVYNSQSNKLELNTDAPANRGHRPATTLDFNQVPLTDVFVSLEKQYKIKITSDPGELSEMSFTGNIQLTQTIDAILEEIARINKLDKVKTPEGYLIRK